MRGDFDEDEFEDYELRPGLDYGDTVVDAGSTFDLDDATPLERGLYNLCREVEQLPASALQTRLSLALSTAMIELWRMRQRLARVAVNRGADHGMRHCRCVDPENCVETIPGYVCRKVGRD
jgi:hypothetical protein